MFRIDLNQREQYHISTGEENIMRLHELFQPEDMFCFLVGSGISLDPPSCLPTGYKFTKELLDRLIPQEQRKAILELTNPDRDTAMGSGNFLRFEQLIGFIYKMYDVDLRILDCYTKAKEPNIIHFFLANMLIKGHSLFTTNFDSLIEHGLQSVGIDNERISPVIFDNDWGTTEESGQHYVHKLHGSCIDTRNGKLCMDTVQVTLERILQGSGKLLQLEVWKREKLRVYLEQQDLIVMGYSGLDDFDILPTLWNIPSSKRILWIKHDSNRLPTQAQVHTVEQLLSCDNMNQPPYLNRVFRNLLMFSHHHSRQASRVFIITVDTTKLVEWLSHRYAIPSSCPEKSANTAAVPVLLPDELSLTDYDKWFLTGFIFKDRGLPLQSIKAFESSLAHTSDSKNRIACLQAIGELTFEQGNIDDAFNQYNQALDIASKTKDNESKANVLIRIGRVYEHQSRFGLALESLEQAFIIAKESGNLEQQAICMNNIGLVLGSQGREKEALDYYKRALNLAEQMGDVSGIITYLCNIGSVQHQNRQFMEATTNYQRAYTIAERSGYLRLEATSLNLLGSLSGDKGKLEQALLYYKRSLEIEDQLGHKAGEAIQLNNIGLIYLKQELFNEAKEYLLRAIPLFEALGWVEESAIATFNVGIAFCHQRQIDNALRYFDLSITILDRIRDDTKKCYALANIGSYLYDEDYLNLALDYYSNAITLAKELGDPQVLLSIQDMFNKIKEDHS